MTQCKNNFEALPVAEYFIRRQAPDQVEFEADYWGPRMDPDGNVRNLLNERERKLKDIAQELAYINARTPGRILDIGCGPGFLLSGVADGWERHGVEMSSFAADHARAWGKIYEGRLEEAGYPADHFDVIVLYQVLEHISEPASLMNEIRRILKEDGRLIICVPNFDSMCARRYGKRYRMLNDPTHVALYAPATLRRLLRDFGFVVEDTQYPFFDTDYFSKENLLKLLEEEVVSPPFYGNIMTFYARKMTVDEARLLLQHLTAQLGNVFSDLT